MRTVCGFCSENTIVLFTLVTLYRFSKIFWIQPCRGMFFVLIFEKIKYTHVHTKKTKRIVMVEKLSRERGTFARRLRCSFVVYSGVFFLFFFLRTPPVVFWILSRTIEYYGKTRKYEFSASASPPPVPTPFPPSRLPSSFGRRCFSSLRDEATHGVRYFFRREKKNKTRLKSIIYAETARAAFVVHIT